MVEGLHGYGGLLTDFHHHFIFGVGSLLRLGLDLSEQTLLGLSFFSHLPFLLCSDLLGLDSFALLPALGAPDLVGVAVRGNLKGVILPAP